MVLNLKSYWSYWSRVKLGLLCVYGMKLCSHSHCSLCSSLLFVFSSLLHDLLSCSYLQHCVWSVITSHNSPQTVVCSELRTSAQRVTSLSLAGAATPTVECKQRMGRRDVHTLSMTYNLTCLSMDVRDCIRRYSLPKCAKTLHTSAQ